MTATSPVLYALILILAIIVASLFVRLVRMNRRIRLLKKTLLELEGESVEPSD